MTRREALKLLQIPNIYPRLDEVKSSYKKLQAVYDPDKQPPERYEIYVQLLQQLTKAYTKIASEEGYETFTDDSFQKKRQRYEYDVKNYKTIFLDEGFVGVVRTYFGRLFRNLKNIIIGDDDFNEAESDAESKKSKKRKKKKEERKKRKHKEKTKNEKHRGKKGRKHDKQKKQKGRRRKKTS